VATAPGAEREKKGSDPEEDSEPLTFEVGAGDTQANVIFEAFDAAVRGLAVGERAEIEAEGGAWDPARLFTVPREHEEVQRLEGRYKNHGGLREGLVVELANGAHALVVAADEASVQLDANSMLAGKKVVFELELVGLEREH
jgi:FKBP-type peptidyl-prolyl cis-trans isomerase 2